MDIVSKAKRSWNMSRIGNRNTSPERAVRSALHRMGYRFRLHVPELPGRPDIVLTRLRTVVFVNGCFWHRHARCRYAYTPATRKSFWVQKFELNRKRDNRVRRQLRRLEWRVVTVWECQTDNSSKLSVRLGQLL